MSNASTWNIAHSLRVAFVYFGAVFGVGFILGPIRILWLVPKVGVRIAELLEMPIMIAVTVVAANWIARRFEIPPLWNLRLKIGGLALAMLLAAEIGLGLLFRTGDRDPVSGAAYVISLGLFALMPALVGLHRSPRSPRRERVHLLFWTF